MRQSEGEHVEPRQAWRTWRRASTSAAMVLVIKKGVKMVTLEWRRQNDMAWLPPGAPLNFGKTVVLRGVGYVPPPPTEFALYRVPSKLVSWALAKQGKETQWEFARRPVHATATEPFIEMDTDSIVLSPGGFFKTHRWQFTDLRGNWSPVVRTTRFSTLTASLSGGAHGASATVGTTIATTVDPRVSIDLSLPWDENSDYPSPRQAVMREVLDDLISAGSSLVTDPTGVVQSLEQFFPTERPSGLEISWEPRQLSLDEGATQTFEAHIYGISTQPFAFCFVAREIDSGDVAVSEVGVMWRDETGAISAFGLEG